jgi:hypothetical protein
MFQGVKSPCQAPERTTVDPTCSSARAMAALNRSRCSLCDSVPAVSAHRVHAGSSRRGASPSRPDRPTSSTASIGNRRRVPACHGDAGRVDSTRTSRPRHDPWCSTRGTRTVSQRADAMHPSATASPRTWPAAVAVSPTFTWASGRPARSKTWRIGLRLARLVPMPRLTVTGCPSTSARWSVIPPPALTTRTPPNRRRGDRTRSAAAMPSRSPTSRAVTALLNRRIATDAPRGESGSSRRGERTDGTAIRSTDGRRSRTAPRSITWISSASGHRRATVSSRSSSAAAIRVEGTEVEARPDQGGTLWRL